jgi:dTDP-4-amino-4,6-dideoxygalactose transaminase
MSRLGGIPRLQVPTDDPHVKAVYHTFVVQAESRDELRKYLEERGIGSAVHYPVPIHLTTAGRELGYPEWSFPVAEEQARRVLSLPVYPELLQWQLDRVCQTIREFYGVSQA